MVGLPRGEGALHGGAQVAAREERVHVRPEECERALAEERQQVLARLRVPRVGDAAAKAIGPGQPADARGQTDERRTN